MSTPNTGLADVGRVIHKEHQDLHAVLTCLRLMAKKARGNDRGNDREDDRENDREESAALNTAALHQAFDYMETVLNAFHHPKEDTYLFPVLRTRCPEIGDVLDELEGQHRQMPDLLNQMRAALARYEDQPEAERDALCDAIEACCTREIGHMKLEEQTVLKQARESLTEADWAAIDTAFADNADPLFGEEKNTAYNALYQELLATMPAPYGYG